MQSVCISFVCWIFFCCCCCFIKHFVSLFFVCFIKHFVCLLCQAFAAPQCHGVPTIQSELKSCQPIDHLLAVYYICESVCPYWLHTIKGVSCQLSAVLLLLAHCLVTAWYVNLGFNSATLKWYVVAAVHVCVNFDLYCATLCYILVTHIYVIPCRLPLVRLSQRRIRTHPSCLTGRSDAKMGGHGRPLTRDSLVSIARPSLLFPHLKSLSSAHLLPTLGVASSSRTF